MIAAGNDTPIAPTPERARRGVELVDKAIADDEGRPSQPYRSIDILARLERRGAITTEMRQAGEEFQVLFRLAHIDTLRAADLMRTGGAHSDPEINKRARESVRKTLLSVGKPGSLGYSCLWHVLGWGQTFKEWAIEQGWRGKPISIHAAPMVLVTVLGVLAKDRAKSA